MENELIEHLISVEQFVLGALEQPETLWCKYLGDSYNNELTRALVDGWLKVHVAAQARTKAESTKWLEAALTAPQIEQRTKEWYDQTLNVLTASEIWTIFKSHRERAMLVMSKVPNSEAALKRRPNILCIPTEFMSAFDWGIRFEPVIKQIYEHMYSVEVKEVGRLKHPSDSRIAASPDGIVVVGQAHAQAHAKSPRLIEIKCPVSRDIGAEIPPEYYAQMQTQMEVTDAPICDYVEAKLRSGYKQGTQQVEGPAIASGIIWRVWCPDDTEKYIYSDVYYKCSMPANIPEPQEPLIVLETIPWDLLGWHEVPVTRNKAWWSNAMVAIESFWADVEAARRGEFVVPESKRKKAVGAEPECLIRFDTE